MNFSSCRLYGIDNLDELEDLLHFESRNYNQRSRIFTRDYRVYLESDKRLIEMPLERLKTIQKTIKTLLEPIVIPRYVFSKSCSSHLDHINIHRNNVKTIIALDIKKFFPSICRDTVYKFWKNDMKMSSSVANIITNLTTIDLSTGNLSGEIDNFIVKNNLAYNHLVSGAPTSTILSFLVNWKVFEEINDYITNEGGCFSLFVDDLIVSGISNKTAVINNVRHILFKRGYKTCFKKLQTAHSRGIELNGVYLTADGKMMLPNDKSRKMRENLSNKDICLGLLNYQKRIMSYNAKQLEDPE